MKLILILWLAVGVIFGAWMTRGVSRENIKRAQDDWFLYAGIFLACVAIWPIYFAVMGYLKLRLRRAK